MPAKALVEKRCQSGLGIHVGMIGLVFLIGAYTYINEIITLFDSSDAHAKHEGIPKFSHQKAEERLQKSLNILRTASSAGRFVSQGHRNSNNKELNWTDTESVEYVVPLQWAQHTGFSQTLEESFHRISHTAQHELALESLPELEQELVEGLRDKTLLFIGDSTTENIHSAMCHCPRGHNVDTAVQGSMEHDTQTECFVDRGKDCTGPAIRTCRLKTLNVTFHSLEGEYSIHPYGPMPYERGQTPECETTMDLTSCLRKKWDASCNSAVSLKCMGDPSCSTHRSPDIVLFNVNLWFWFRMQWYGLSDEKDYLSMPWDDVTEAYITNMTVAMSTLVDYMQDTKVFALQTSPGTKTGSRIQMPKVMHINSAIRELVSNAETNTERIALLELEHMGHMGWERESFLSDDMHPQVVFNNAVSNILLNALAVL